MKKLIDYYNFWLPCQGVDGADGAPVDALGIIGSAGLGGNLNDAGLLNTEIWNNPGFATTKKAIDGGFFIYGDSLHRLPKNNGASDNQNASIILSYIVKGVTTVNGFMVGTAGAAGADLINDPDGIGVRMDINGGGRINVWTNVGGTTVTAHSDVAANAYTHATEERHHFIAIDGARNSAFLAINGVWKSLNSDTAWDISAAVLAGNKVGEGLQFGVVGAATGEALQFKDIKLASFDGMLPVNLTEIMRKFYFQPMQSHKDLRIAL